MMYDFWESSYGLRVNVPALFAETLEALTGKGADLHFQNSPSVGAYGSVSKDESGRMHVYISPNMDLNAIYEVFLHEAAHLKYHSEAISKSNISTLPEWSYTNLAKANPAYIAQESEADKQRAIWLDYANKNAWRVAAEDARYTGMHPVIYKLIALKGLKNG